MIRAALLVAFTLAGLSVFAQDNALTLEAAKAEFAKADRELNDAWMSVKKKLPKVRFDPLIAIQREWVIFRNERAESTAGAREPGAVKAQSSPAYFIKAARLTEDRASWLRRLARDEDEPLTGLWIDGNGGSLAMVEQTGRLFFEFHVARGRMPHLGQLGGIGVWNSGLGWFSDKGKERDEPGETNIAFISRSGPRLEVIAANARVYLGGRAYIDGSYFKAASLSAADQAATVRAAESGEALEMLEIYQ